MIVPFTKKGEKGDSNNYRPISMTSHPAKILTKILLDRLKSLTDITLQEYQASFRRDRSTIDHIFSTRQLMEKNIEIAKELLLLFIDFKQAFDLIWRNGLWHILLHYGVPKNMVTLIKDMYLNFCSQVQTPEGLTEEFQTSAGVLQGYLLSPHLFNLFLNAALSLAKTTDGASIGGKLVDKLAYADDIVKINSHEHLLQTDTNEIVSATEALGMVVNTTKTKVMRVSRDSAPRAIQLTIKGEQIENAESFVYLGSLLTSNNDCSKSIRCRLGLATSSFKSLSSIWKSKLLSKSLNFRLFNSLIIPIAMYASETWSIKADDERRISAFETKCLRRIAGITYIDRVSNEDLRKLLHCSYTIMDRIRSQQFRWFGHI